MNGLMYLVIVREVCIRLRGRGRCGKNDLSWRFNYFQLSASWRATVTSSDLIWYGQGGTWERENALAHRVLLVCRTSQHWSIFPFECFKEFDWLDGLSKASSVAIDCPQFYYWSVTLKCQTKMGEEIREIGGNWRDKGGLTSKKNVCYSLRNCCTLLLNLGYPITSTAY